MELVSALTSDKFLLALYEYNLRRGKPSNMIIYGHDIYYCVKPSPNELLKLT